MTRAEILATQQEIVKNHYEQHGATELLHQQFKERNKSLRIKFESMEVNHEPNA